MRHIKGDGVFDFHRSRCRRCHFGQLAADGAVFRHRRMEYEYSARNDSGRLFRRAICHDHGTDHQLCGAALDDGDVWAHWYCGDLLFLRKVILYGADYGAADLYHSAYAFVLELRVAAADSVLYAGDHVYGGQRTAVSAGGAGWLCL